MLNFNPTITHFLLLNLLTILIVGLIYFVVKEIYRIRNGKVGKVGIILIGSGLGMLIASINFWAVLTIFYEHNSLISGDINTYLVYNGLIISPTIIIIIIFSTSVDRRLVYPMFAFQATSLILIMPFAEGVNIFDQENSFIWTKLLFEFITYSIVIVLITFIPSLNLIKNNGIKLVVLIFAYFVILLIIDFVYHTTISSEDFSWMSTTKIITLETIQLTYIFIYSIIQMSIVFVVNRVYSNYSTLETFSTRDDVSYYKISMAHNALIKMIDEKRITNGIIVLFNIKTDDSSILTNILKSIREKTEDKYKNTFYFKASANYYGAFFELGENFKIDKVLSNNKSSTRTDDDDLCHISNSIDSISKFYKVEINAGGSIYGIHSYNIVELIEYSRFLLSPAVSRANSNSLIVYDFKRVKERLNETTQVRNLPVDIENMTISYSRGISSEDVFYPNISFENASGNIFNEIENKNLNEDQIETLLRFSAYQTLRKFEKLESSLVLFYSLNYLSKEDFNSKDFIKKVNRYLPEDKLIVGIDTSTNKITNKLLSNIQNLRSLGIRFAATNPSTLTQEDENMIGFDFILDPNMDVNLLKVKKIKIEIKTNATILNSNLVL